MATLPSAVSRTQRDAAHDFTPLARGKDLSPDEYPALNTLSAAFLQELMPHPLEPKAPEFTYVPLYPREKIGDNAATRVWVTISRWNMAWEAAELRHELFHDDLPGELAWTRRYSDQNLYLLPKTSTHHYYSYVPLYHMLPRSTVEHFGLPCLKRGIWPFLADDPRLDQCVPADFDARLARAFASHIWRFIDSGSSLGAFSTSDPLKLLAHNLDFWLPYAIRVVERRIQALGRVAFEDEEQERTLARIRADAPPGYAVDRPFFGGPLWWGEDDAVEATWDLVDEADDNGKLREIIDAVKSNRVEDDFSPRWSYAREDFERRLYRRRNKVRVRFPFLPK